METCEGCKFWKRMDAEHMGDAGAGYCRRYPPSFMLENTLNDGWPNVHAQEWCGEWRGLTP